MEAERTDRYCLFGDKDSRQDFCIDIETDNTYDENASRKVKALHWCFLLIKYVKLDLQLSLICGVLFGMFATFLWWIELNLKLSCFGEWKGIPSNIHHFALMSTCIKVLVIMFWPLLTILPISSWSMIKESNLLFWCTIAGLVDVVDRLYLYIFAHYEAHWKSVVGNFIFSAISFLVIFKFVKYRQRHSGNKGSTVIATLKLGIQVLVGVSVTLPYNYVFLEFYQQSTMLTKTILSCSLVALFYVLKLIISNLITSLHGIYKPTEGISFASAFLVIAPMITRLTQAKIESLPYFTLISLVHGVVNVIDKVALPVRRKLSNLVCRKGNDVRNESWIYTQQYIAHQSLLGIITEISSVIMSNAAAYILVYYYKTEEGTGSRYDGLILIRDLLLRLVIGVSIECVFNVAALYIQNECCNIPMLRSWKQDWKFIIILLVIQMIFLINCAHYVDRMLLGNVLSNSTQICVGLFRRL